MIYGLTYCVWIVLMMLVTITSVQHIHKNSKSIEIYGIKANSTLMKIYSGCWAVILIVLIFISVLTVVLILELVNSDDGIDLEKELRILITCQAMFTLLMMTTGVLDMIVLYAYHRLSNRVAA